MDRPQRAPSPRPRPHPLDPAPPRLQGSPKPGPPPSCHRRSAEGSARCRGALVSEGSARALSAAARCELHGRGGPERAGSCSGGGRAAQVHSVAAWGRLGPHAAVGRMLRCACCGQALGTVERPPLHAQVLAHYAQRARRLRCHAPMRGTHAACARMCHAWHMGAARAAGGPTSMSGGPSLSIAGPSAGMLEASLRTRGGGLAVR